MNERKPMEPRPDNLPKFNIKNKTDRKIIGFVIISSLILLALIAGCILLYYFVL